MIVFKNYFKILKRYKFIILLYTAVLLVFTFTSSKSDNKIVSFTAEKPDVAIINLDGNSKIIENFYEYMKKNTNIKEIENNKEKIDDSLFYEDINAVIYIYKGYTEDYLNNKDKKLDVKYGNNAYSSYVDMILKKYFKIADIANDEFTKDKDIIELINVTISKETQIEVQNTLDTDAVGRASYFFNFSNYSILSICIYITSIIILRFNDEKIRKRNIVSSTKIRSITKELYLGNLVFVTIVWIALIALSFIIVGDPMFTKNGLLLILNSLIFMTCGLSIGFLVGNLLKNENVISAIVNIVALGSSFLCGSFIPAEFLPETVVKISKILPSYWYIHNNNLIKEMEIINLDTIMPIFVNMEIVILFSILFIIATNLISKKKI